jgi:superfamily II DNA or RNA helicase
MPKLRDYQEKSIDNLRNGFANHLTQMLYAPTGAGKTETAI